jgi:hypothetical protein
LKYLPSKLRQKIPYFSLYLPVIFLILYFFEEWSFYYVTNYVIGLLFAVAMREVRVFGKEDSNSALRTYEPALDISVYYPVYRNA